MRLTRLTEATELVQRRDSERDGSCFRTPSYGEAGTLSVSASFRVNFHHSSNLCTLLLHKNFKP